MKIEENGVVQIPPELQKSFGLTPGVEVQWVTHGENLILKKRTRREIAEKWLQEKGGQGKGRIDIEAWLKITRSEV